jgi:CheY-like chemotaxis protein
MFAALAGMSKPEVGMGTKKVLVIDDDDVAAELVRITVHDKPDIQFLHAKDGVQGVGLAVSEKPDLIFLDLMMPTLDGFQVARILKGNPAFASIPIVVMSARAGKEGKDKTTEIGCEAFLYKPVKTGEIRDMIARYLGPPG